jgi:gamma-glutamylcyclotransferase (GGCT)/AIG2-like uncharacterized protein YtfP
VLFDGLHHGSIDEGGARSGATRRARYGRAMAVPLFVYGSLRRRSGAPMALRLAQAARWLGRAQVRGHLYRVADYPGFVPDPAAPAVIGDLFLPHDPDPLLAEMDAYEECSDAFPRPQEYRRERLVVEGAGGPVEAWVYVYAWPVDGLERIEGGDFLEGA